MIETHLSTQLLQRARHDALRSGRHVLEILEERSGLLPEALVAELADLFMFSALDMADFVVMQADFSRITFPDAHRRGCVLFRRADGEVLVVLSDPFDGHLMEWVESLVTGFITYGLAHHTVLAAYLARHEDTMRAMDGLTQSSNETSPNAQDVEELSLKSISEDSSQVVRTVHSTLYDAMKAGASDIHIETDSTGLTIKYRIDGVLSQISTLVGVEQSEQIISRIKVMAELDIAERRVPQDGRFRVVTQGREVDFRVSIMPSIFGEDAVLRILDRRALSGTMQNLRLDSLGFEESTIAVIRRLVNEPYGMVLVTGPTGSGKTTTLYGAISEINRGEDKIITIEDPVEYRLSGVLQIPVNERKGLTFAKGLRSILRHDPDKIMVGEIRDSETAQIAVQSALTGHLVLTTVHANNVFDVIGRFMHMGVDPYSFVAAMNGIVAQRLVRLLCPACAQDTAPTESLLSDSGISMEDATHYRFRHAQGCPACRGMGYKGRKAIAEFLILNDEIRELIVAREPIRKIKEAARRQGTRYLRESALVLVQRGETSLQEINRVTFVT
jgi:general secretion pathway protein E